MSVVEKGSMTGATEKMRLALVVVEGESAGGAGGRVGAGVGVGESGGGVGGKSLKKDGSTMG